MEEIVYVLCGIYVIMFGLNIFTSIQDAEEWAEKYPYKNPYTSKGSYNGLDE